jgi:hypothetical protein
MHFETCRKASFSDDCERITGYARLTLLRVAHELAAQSHSHPKLATNNIASFYQRLLTNLKTQNAERGPQSGAPPRESHEASRCFKAVRVPGFALTLRQTPFSSYDSLRTWTFLRMSASTPSLP